MNDGKGGKGGNWTNTLTLIDYEDHESMKTTLEEQQLLDHFEKELKANKEEILEAKIWKHPLKIPLPRLFGNSRNISLPGIVGDWHEYTVVKSTNWYWSFEKQKNAICVQRSKEETNVKNKLNRKDRVERIGPEGRSKDSVEHGETIYNIIEWIINNEELSNTYHVTQSNCHYFASELYEAIVRDRGKRLNDKGRKEKERETREDRLRILRPGLRSFLSLLRIRWNWKSRVTKDRQL